MKIKKTLLVISCSLAGLSLNSCATNTDKDSNYNSSNTQITSNYDKKAIQPSIATDETATDVSKQVKKQDNVKIKKETNITENESKTTESSKEINNEQDSAGVKQEISANASYTIGYQISSGIAKQGLDLNNNEIAAGFTDAINGKKPRLSEDQMNKNMQSLKDQIIKKQEEIANSNKVKSQEFMTQIAKLDNIVKVNDGVYYQVVKQGDGKKPSADSQVTIAYKGTLPVVAYTDDKSSLNAIKQAKLIGPKFDANSNATFPLSNLIECWKDAIPTIPTGSEIILYCSPEKAYGTMAPASIGPNQALSFEITLKDFK